MHITAAPRVAAIICPERRNNVLEVLCRAEVRGLTVSEVQGHGGETAQVETFRGTTVKIDLQAPIRLEIACASGDRSHHTIPW